MDEASTWGRLKDVEKGVWWNFKWGLVSRRGYEGRQAWPRRNREGAKKKFWSSASEPKPVKRWGGGCIVLLR